VARAAAVEPLDPLDARRPCSGRGAGVDGAGFREGGSGELCRQAAGQWRGVRARDLRGRRPWGVDPRWCSPSAYAALSWPVMSPAASGSGSGLMWRRGGA